MVIVIGLKACEHFGAQVYVCEINMNFVSLVVLGRFQKSSVPVLNLKVLFGSGFDRFYKNLNFGTGSRGFGSTVLTVLRFFWKTMKLNNFLWRLTIRLAILYPNLGKRLRFPVKLIRKLPKMHIGINFDWSLEALLCKISQNLPKIGVSGTRGSDIRFRFLIGFQFCLNFGSGSFQFPKIGVRTVGSSVSARIDQALLTIWVPCSIFMADALRAI